MYAIENCKGNEAKKGGIWRSNKTKYIYIFHIFRILCLLKRITQPEEKGGGGGAGKGEAPPSRPHALAVVCALLWTSLGSCPEACVARMCDLNEPQPAEKIGKEEEVAETFVG